MRLIWVLRTFLLPAFIAAPAFAQSYSQSAFCARAGQLVDNRDTPFILKNNYQVPQIGELAFTDARVAGVAASAGASSVDNVAAAAEATSVFRDALLITAPGLAGQTGTLTLRVHSSFSVIGMSGGSVDASGACHVSVGAVMAGDSFVTYLGGGWLGQAAPDDPYTFGGEITAPFTFGDAVQLSLGVGASSDTQTMNSGGEIPQFCSVGFVAGFAGVASIKDADGNEVLGASSLTASSGFDYTLSAALPSTQTIPPGDSNLDYAVDFADLVTLAQNYGAANGKRWGQGDFNGDGAIDFADLVILAQHYGDGTAAIEEPAPAFASDWALAQSLVPEPTTLGALAAASSVLLRRCRR